MDVLFLKIYVHTDLFQFPDDREQRDCVPREAADGFCDDHIYLAGFAVIYQPRELLPAVFGARLGFVGIAAAPISEESGNSIAGI